MILMTTLMLRLQAAVNWIYCWQWETSFGAELSDIDVFEEDNEDNGSDEDLEWRSS